MRWLALLLLVPLVGAYGPLGDADGDGVGDFTDGQGVLIARSGVTGQPIWTSDGRITIDANMDGALDLLRFRHHETYLLSGTDLTTIAGPFQGKSSQTGTGSEPLLLGGDKEWAWMTQTNWLLPGHILEITSNLRQTSKDSIGTQSAYIGNQSSRNTQELQVQSLLGQQGWSWGAPAGKHVANRFQVGPDFSGDGVPDLLLSLLVETDRSTRSIAWLNTATGESHLLLEEFGDELLDLEWVGDADGWLLVQDDNWRSLNVKGQLLAAAERQGAVLADLETSDGAVLQTPSAFVNRQLQRALYHHELDDLFAGVKGDVYLQTNDGLALLDAETGSTLWNRPLENLIAAQGFDDGLIISAQTFDGLLITALHADGTTSWTQSALPAGVGPVTFTRIPDMTGDGAAELAVEQNPKIPCTCGPQRAILNAADGTLLMSSYVENRLSPIAEIHSLPVSPLLAWAPLALLALIRRFYQR